MRPVTTLPVQQQHADVISGVVNLVGEDDSTEDVGGWAGGGRQQHSEAARVIHRLRGTVVVAVTAR